MTDFKKNAVIGATTVDPKTSTSIIDYLFNPEQIKVSNKGLSIEQWIGILRRLIKLTKPHLRYFDGFREIQDLIHHEWWRKINFLEGPPYKTEIVYSDGVTEKTRIISITKSYTGLGGNKGPKLNRDFFHENLSPIDRYYVSEEIFLSLNGEIVLASFERDRCISEDRSTKISFEKLKDEVYIDFVKKSFNRIIDPILSLQGIIDQGTRRRQEQLNQMKEISTVIKRLSNLIR